VTVADTAAINNPQAAFIPTLCMGVLDPVAIILRR
jgi:hypothetical protein